MNLCIRLNFAYLLFCTISGSFYNKYHKKLIKSDSEDIYMVTYKIFLFQINDVILNFLFTKESWKNGSWLPQLIPADNNNKWFFITKSAY